MAQAVLAMPGPSARFINRNWPFTLWQLLILLFLGGISCASVHACTLWGAAGVDAGGGTIISKNRDWKPDHVQVLKMQRPTNGYAYFGLYAEGNDAPGIKEGINEKGLTVVTASAGTIPKQTREAQPGKGSLISTLLANCANCDEVLAQQDKLFSQRRPTFVMIADRKQILMLEVGLQGRYSMRAVKTGTVVHANHYLDEAMQEFNLKTNRSSCARVKRIADLLQAAPRPFDTAQFASMSRDRHGGPNNSLWRTGTNGCTLSSWIVETPAQGAPRLRVLIANPNQPEELRQYVLDNTFWKKPAGTAAIQAATCEGAYERHLQGICTNERDALYWSWTDALVKTDRHGRILKRLEVASHHGDLCHHLGEVFVAVNLGAFNRPAGYANSWVFVYDADTLIERARHPVPEVEHGAGGIAYHKGRFIVVGGLPEGVNENYLYEYDEKFAFRKRHVLASGYTLMGIQTVAFAEGAWWFGCYGTPKVLLRANPRLQLTDRWEFDASLGIVGLGNQRFLIGQNNKRPNVGYEGRAAIARFTAEKGLIFE